MSARRKRRRERQRRRHHEGKPQVSWAPPGELHQVRDVERLAYSRKEAAEALALSISTIDRRLVPAVSTVKTPWGQRLIPVAELERFVREHLEPARARAARRPAGRPPADAAAERRRPDQAGAYARSEPWRDRQDAQSGRCPDRTRRSPLVAVDGPGHPRTGGKRTGAAVSGLRLELVVS
jgi:hypothetical protein